jgi:hypothetical protein
MNYTSTEDQADELGLYAENCERWHRARFIPIQDNLHRKMDKGTYSRERAVAWIAREPLQDLARIYRAEVDQLQTFRLESRRVTALYLVSLIEDEYKYRQTKDVA